MKQIKDCYIASPNPKTKSKKYELWVEKNNTIRIFLNEGNICHYTITDVIGFSGIKKLNHTILRKKGKRK